MVLAQVDSSKTLTTLGFLSNGLIRFSIPVRNPSCSHASQHSRLPHVLATMTILGLSCNRHVIAVHVALLSNRLAPQVPKQKLHGLFLTRFGVSLYEYFNRQ